MRYILFVLAALFVLGPLDAADGGAAESMNDTSAAMNAGNGGAARFAEWDVDDDKRLSRQEFFAGFEASGVFEDWDVDHSGALDTHEVGEGMYSTWDYDDDSTIEIDEKGGYWFREDRG